MGLYRLQHRAPQADDVTRRVKAFKVPYRILLDFLNQAAGGAPSGNLYVLPKAVNLPDGYRVLHVHMDFMRNCCVFMVCHPTWPITQDDNPSTNPIEPVELEWRTVQMTGIEC
jgi:hypothetical protein